MSTRRAFLASLGAGLAGLGLPGAAGAWGRRRRCSPVPCMPVECAPSPGFAPFRALLPNNNDWCCCQSEQQVGDLYSYSCIDCTTGGKAFSFQIATEAYSTTTGCPTSSGACFRWPPSGYGALWYATASTSTNFVPDSLKQNGLQHYFDPSASLPSAKGEANKGKHWDVEIPGTTFGTVHAHLMLWEMAIWPDSGKDYIEVPIGLETNVGFKAVRAVAPTFKQDRYYIQLNAHGYAWD